MCVCIGGVSVLGVCLYWGCVCIGGMCVLGCMPVLGVYPFWGFGSVSVLGVWCIRDMSVLGVCLSS